MAGYDDTRGQSHQTDWPGFGTPHPACHELQRTPAPAPHATTTDHSRKEFEDHKEQMRQEQQEKAAEKAAKIKNALSRGSAIEAYKAPPCPLILNPATRGQNPTLTGSFFLRRLRR